MIPLLIISADDLLVNNYLNKLKEDHLFFEITPITKEYSIEDIKGIIKETKVFHPQVRIYFFPNFHLSSIPAQNSFLKLLEEPPYNVQFILSTDNKNRLLPTIVSRVKLIKLIKQDLIKLDKILQNDLEDLINKQNLKVLNKSYFSQVKKIEAMNLLDQIIYFFRERLASDTKSPQIIKEIIRLRALLENNNLNPQLTIDQGLIFIWKMYRMKL